jgi:tetratricopeptide (TPR) repeat protein
MAPVLRVLGYPEDPMGIFKQGETISAELEDHRGMAIICGSVGMYYSMKGKLTLGRSYLERSFHEAAKASDLDTLGPLAYGLFTSYLWEGRFTRIADMAPGVIRLLEETHRELEDFGTPANLYSALYGQCGHGLAWLGDFENAEEHCRKGLSFARKVGHLFSIGAAEMHYGIVLTLRGIGEGAAEHFRRSIETFEESQGTVFIPTVHGCLGGAHYLSGDVPRALEHMEKGLRMQEASGLPFYLSLHHYYLGTAYLEVGDLTKALFHAQEAVNLARKHNERGVEGLAMGPLGRVGWKTQKMKLDEAEGSIRQGIKIAEELETRTVEAMSYHSLGELFADAGQREQALENLKNAEKMYLDMGLDSRSYWLARTQEAKARLGE